MTPHADQRATILIADDSTVIRAVVRDQLEAEGYDVHEAADGEAAIAACREVEPDAVLLDVEMPGLDGREVLARLKGDPALRDIPVVFLTGRTATDDLVAAIRAGAHDYLKKPFEPAELIARIGGAVHIKQLQDELRRRNSELDLVARIDALTQLYNRRHLEEQLHRCSAVSRRMGTSLGVVLFDIDHFKLVNDTHGHGGGDVVLQECAGRLLRSTRAGDMLGRWGGEEFLAILPNTDVDGAALAAERMRQAVGATPITLEHALLTVTISAGVTAHEAAGVDQLLHEADVALYRAKAAGRNQVLTSGS